MTDHTQMHASCVAFEQKAVLIQGAPGRGKSALALQLMALGCRLVADDRVDLRSNGPNISANSPDAIKGLIEARHIGLLNAECEPQATVVLVVDLDQTELQRLPKKRWITVLGSEIALIHANDGPHFAAAILQILKAGWSDR